MPGCQKHLVIPNTVQVILQWGNGTKFPRNVLHGTIGASTPVDVTMANSIMTAWNNLMGSSLLTAQLGLDQSTNSVILRDVRNPNLAEVSSNVAGVVGTATGDDLPHQIACVLTIRTAFAGRGFRGRAYLPCWTEDSNGASGQMSAAAKTAADAFAAGFIGVFTAGGVTLGVAKRPIFNPDDCSITTPGVTNPATQVIVRNNLWDTQRRRAGRT